MSTNNLSLDQIADKCAQAGYVLWHEGSTVAADDLYTMCADLEQALQAMLTMAHQAELREQRALEHQVRAWDQNQRVLDFGCEL